MIDFCKDAKEYDVDVLNILRGNIITAATLYEVAPVDIENGFNVEDGERIYDSVIIPVDYIILPYKIVTVSIIFRFFGNQINPIRYTSVPDRSARHHRMLRKWSFHPYPRRCRCGCTTDKTGSRRYPTHTHNPARRKQS